MRRVTITAVGCLLVPSSLLAVQQAADPKPLASSHESVSGTDSFIGGGRRNRASGDRSVVTGGYGNVASGYGATISGGQLNKASGAWSIVSGGASSLAKGEYATVGGGQLNRAEGPGSVVAGGSRNEALTGYYDTGYSVVSGGAGNRAEGDYSTVAGGGQNTAFRLAVVGGGRDNHAAETGSTIAGGAGNVTGYWSTVSGGLTNDASGIGFNTIGGGNYNRTSAQGRSGWFSTIAGGFFNDSVGYCSTVPGGRANVAVGDFSFAAGAFTRADHHGSFVWGDRSGLPGSPQASSAEDEFNIYASGGTRIFSSGDGSTGVLLAPGGGSWTSVSDRNAKENFEPVDGQAILDQLASIPISTWNYKAQGDSVRHMGPMAQDFYAAFGLGLGDNGIDTIDPDGVALAAIQALNAKLDAELAKKDAEIAALRERLGERVRTAE